MKNSIHKTVLALSLSFALGFASAYSAEVPSNVILSDKQEIVRNNGAEPQSLDPHKIEGVPESNLARDQFEGLVITDANGEVIPGVAERWENDDAKVWRFYLRKDAKWSNGDPVTAHDFVYSWRRLADPKTASNYASYLQYAHVENIDDIIIGKKDSETLGVKALDDYTFEVTLSEKVPYLPKIAVHVVLSPVNQKVVEAYGDRWTQPEHFVGNGAYKLASWVVNERIVLERNPFYWNNAKTVIDKVTFLPLESEVTDVNRYRSGEIDMTHNQLPIELFDRLKRDIPNEVQVSPYLCTYYYELNNERAPFDDVRVRTALKLGLDRDIVVNKVLAQGQSEAFGFTPPYIADMDAIKPQWFGLTQKERNEKAKALLEEAGFNKKNPLSFKLLYNTSESHKKLAIAVSSLWKQNLGVEVRLENQEWKTFLDSRHQGTYDVARAGWCADYNEPSTFLNIMLSSSSNNTSKYKSDTFDAAMARSMDAKDDKERVKAYQEAETVLDGDSAIVPVYYYVNARLVKPYVGGYSIKDPLDNVYTKNLYIIKH